MTSLPDLSRYAAWDELLREVATDAEAVEAATTVAASRLEGARTRGDVSDEVRLLGYLGNANRMLGRHDESIALSRKALDVASLSGDERSRAVALVRLGEAYRCADSFAQAATCLEEAALLTRSTPLSDLEDFALQHLGKTYLDSGDVDRARECLLRALELRERKDDEDLLESTRRALARAERASG